MLRRNFIQQAFSGLVAAIALPFCMVKSKNDDVKQVKYNWDAKISNKDISGGTYTCRDANNKVVWEKFLVWDSKQSKFVDFDEMIEPVYNIMAHTTT